MGELFGSHLSLPSPNSLPIRLGGEEDYVGKKNKFSQYFKKTGFFLYLYTLHI
jgi:hypothetical protein